MLHLAKFDEKIHFYLGVQSDIAALRHSQDVGFVRVNAQPIKQAIRWVAHWDGRWIQGGRAKHLLLRRFVCGDAREATRVTPRCSIVHA